MIYLDSASTTPVLPAVEGAMRPYLLSRFGNPGSLHRLGREAQDAVEAARAKIANAVGATAGEIIFTSGATEANNLALNLLRRTGKRHFIVSAIEHGSLAEPAKALAQRGIRLTVLPVDAEGFVDARALEKAITRETGLVSIIAGNHEIGTIQDVTALAAVCRKRKVLFHTDAAQAFTKIPLHAKKMRIDAMTLSAHKLHGPKGVGALYVRDGIQVPPILFGGGQEGGRRSGTENVAGIMGFAKAVELARGDRASLARMRRLRDRLIKGLLAVPRSRLHGPKGAARLPHIVSVGFAGIDGEELVQHLSLQGVYASAGSTCQHGSPEVSPVLRAIKAPASYARGTLRLGLSRLTTEKEIDAAVRAVTKTAAALRRI